MNYDMLIAGVAGIGPALVLMFWTLSDYTYPRMERPLFDDRKLFGLFAIGLVIGTIVYAIHTWFMLEVVIIALGFAVAEELAKLVILNLPRFQGKLDTTFYGLSLGLGIGSTMGFGSFYIVLGTFTEITAASYVMLILIAVQFVLLHGSTGATIGMGVARNMPWGFYAQAALVHLVYNMLMIPFFQFEGFLGYLAFGAATVILAAYYYYIHYRMIPDTVEDEIANFRAQSKS